MLHETVAKSVELTLSVSDVARRDTALENYITNSLQEQYIQVYY